VEPLGGSGKLAEPLPATEHDLEEAHHKVVLHGQAEADQEDIGSGE